MGTPVSSAVSRSRSRTVERRPSAATVKVASTRSSPLGGLRDDTRHAAGGADHVGHLGSHDQAEAGIPAALGRPAG